MLKHPGIYVFRSCCFVSFEKVSKIILDQLNRLKNTLNRFTKVSDLRWIDSYPLESIHTWVVSFVIESSHKTFWFALEPIHKHFELIHLHSLFTWIDSYMHWIVSVFLLLCSVFDCLNRFKHLTSVDLVRKLSLFCFTIYTLFPTTPKSLNHLHLFSIGLKNSFLIHSSRLNTFS